MSLSPEALVLLLDAAVTNDDLAMSFLIRRFPTMAKRYADLTEGERASIYDSDYTNHFYTCDGNGTPKYGLVIEENRPTARQRVQERNLHEHVYWGANTDPVKLATIADVVDCMHKTSPKDALLAIMDSATTGRSSQKKPRADAVVADDHATADRLTSIAWLLKCLELWPHSDVDAITAEMHGRIAKVRNVDTLSAFITEYLDNYDAQKLKPFIIQLGQKKLLIKSIYKLPDGEGGPVDYWEKAYAAAKSSEWAQLLAE